MEQGIKPRSPKVQMLASGPSFLSCTASTLSLAFKNILTTMIPTLFLHPLTQLLNLCPPSWYFPLCQEGEPCCDQGG